MFAECFDELNFMTTISKDGSNIIIFLVAPATIGTTSSSESSFSSSCSS